MPSTYAHNAIGEDNRKGKEKRKEKVGKTTDRREKVDRTSDRQVKERTRLEMFLRYRLCLLAQ